MDLNAITLEQYTANPLDVQLDCRIFSQGVKRLFQSLLSFPSCLYNIRYSVLTKLVNRLIKENTFRPFSFEVKRGQSTAAGIKKHGVICFSYDFFRRSSRESFMAILCHELAHIWLRQQPFYGNLKAVNKQYKSISADICGSEQATATSPEELYARILSLNFLRTVTADVQAEDVKRHLQVRIDKLDAKINLLNNQIKCLQL